MPKVRTVTDVVSNLLAPATTSHFEVEIGLPGSPGEDLYERLKFRSQTEQRKLNLMCSEAVLPGSSLATTEVNNDFTGVTERHAYRRIYDETIDLTFYVDAKNYWPIKFFEEWISGIVNEDQDDAKNQNYFYRVKYPDDYVATGLKVIKFEKDHHDQTRDIKWTRGARSYKIRSGSGSQIEYEFIRSYPRSITSMPLSYDGSSLLKCSVQMTYMRYVVNTLKGRTTGFDPFQQASFNSNGMQGLLGNLTDAAVDQLTGNDFAGDVAGSIVSRGFKATARDVLGNVMNSGSFF